MSRVAHIEESTELTTTEQERLAELEDVVERGLKTFVEVGNALMEIRDSRLYRDAYGTFEEYCRDRWLVDRTYAHRIMAAADVASNLLPIGNIPANEAQARPLAALDPEAQRKAWQRAVETAPNGKITGAHVERTIGEMTKPDPVPAPDPLPDARVVEVDAEYFKKVDAAYSGDRIGQGRIKRPYEYDGRLYITTSGLGAGEAKRVIPAEEWPYKPVESHRKARELNESGPGYYHGWKVYFGSQPFILDATDRIKFVPAKYTADVESERFAPIWELEKWVHSWLSSITGGDRSLQIKLLENIKNGVPGAFIRFIQSQHIKGPYRKHELKQAVNNVLEQLRQVEVSQEAMEVSEHTSSQAPANILHSSDSNEYYTPAQYVEAAREVMGGIDLDPASCALANETVEAETFYTADDDGLQQEWFGKVFLNPPYGKDGNESNQGKWSHRLIEEYEAGNVDEAILLVNATPGNKWWAPLWYYLICFPDHRIHFNTPEGETKQATHSNAFVYLGKNTERFVEVFSRFGPVVTEVISDNA